MPKAPSRKPRRSADNKKSPGDFAELVRYSREGDQFHYLWAARRLLRLLDLASPLVAVAIEGVSPQETDGSPGVRTGEGVVDLTEYEGRERLCHLGAAWQIRTAA